MTINGQRAKIAQLVPGLDVAVESREPGYAQVIAANGPLQTKVIPVQRSEGLIDLNKASAEELDRLPGVGPVLAEAILRARPFTRVDDLSRVRGIGEKTMEKLRPFVTITERTE